MGLTWAFAMTEAGRKRFVCFEVSPPEKRTGHRCHGRSVQRETGVRHADDQFVKDELERRQRGIREPSV